jgi:hypothetical protein
MSSTPTPRARAPDRTARAHAGARRRCRQPGEPRRPLGQLAVVWPTLPCQANVPTPTTHDILTRIPLTNHPSS